MGGGYDSEFLGDIFEKTGGHCRYCGKQLAWSNYGRVGKHGAWEVDHSVPLSRGGTDYYRNLWPACVACNTDKGTLTGSEYLRGAGSSGSGRSGPNLGDVIGGIVVAGLALAFLGALFRRNDSTPR